MSDILISLYSRGETHIRRVDALPLLLHLLYRKGCTTNTLNLFYCVFFTNRRTVYHFGMLILYNNSQQLLH